MAVTQSDIDQLNSYLKGNTKDLSLGGEKLIVGGKEIPKSDSGKVSYVDIKTGQPKAAPGVSTITSQDPYLGKRSFYGQSIQRGFQETAEERAYPQYAKMREELAVKQGFLKGGETYNEAQSYEAYKKSEEKLGKSIEERNKQIESVNVNEIPDLNKEYDVLSEKQTEFKTKYADYYDPLSNSYVGLPAQGIAEMGGLNLFSTLYQKRASKVNELVNFSSTLQKDVDTYNELQRLKGLSYARKEKEYNAIASRLEADRYKSVIPQVNDMVSLEYKRREFEDIGNVEYKTKDVFSYRSPFKEINIPFYKGDDETQAGFFSTGFSNLQTLHLLSNYNLAQTSVGKKKEEFIIGVGDIISKSADIQREQDIKTAKEMDLAGIESTSFKRRSLLKEKFTRTASDAAYWINKNTVEVGLLGLTAPVTAPVLSYGVGLSAASVVGINLFESFGTLSASRSGVNVAFEKGEKGIRSDIIRGLKAESELYKDRPIASFTMNYLPGGNLIFQDIGYASKVGAEYDSSSYKEYLRTRIAGGRVGVIPGLIGGEVAGELSGRRLTNAFASSKAAEIIKTGKTKGAFWSTFKETAPKITMAAPAEVMASYTATQYGSYQPIKSSEIIGGSLIAAPFAGIIGGAIAGGYVAGKIKPKSKYARFGKYVDVAASIADLPEKPGDVTTDILLAGKGKVRTYFDSISVNMEQKQQQFANEYSGWYDSKTSIYQTNRNAEYINVNQPVSEKTIVPIYTTLSTKTNLPVVTKISTNLPILNNEIMAEKQVTRANTKNINMMNRMQSIVPSEAKETMQIKTAENVNTFVNVPVVVTDKGGAFIPPMLLGGWGNLGQGKRKKRKYGYTASMDALLLGIYSTKKPTQQLYTGQELRPIIGKKPQSWASAWGI